MTNTERSYLTRKRDIFILTIILSAVLIIVGYIYYRYEENNIRTEKYTALKAIAELKTTQITDWYKDELEDAEILSRNPVLREEIGKLVISQNYFLKSKILKNFSEIKEEHKYQNILLADTTGKLLMSFDSTYTQLDSSIVQFVRQSIIKKKVVAIDLYKDQVSRKIQLGFVSPILSRSNEPIAVLILIIDPGNFLYPLIQTWPTPSKTAETIIVRKQGDSTLFLNELRHTKNTALRLRFKLDRTNIPAVQAVLGLQNIYEGFDYRGVKVLSDLRLVPETNWFMIAKVDVDEIYSELYYRTAVIIIFILLLILLIGAGLAWVYQLKQRNIFRELYEKEKQLWESQEEFKTTLYSIGDGVITTDIYGNIKQMNYEAERLTGWSEADAKGKYLEDVFVIINEVTRHSVDNPVKRVLREGKSIGLANHTVLISKGGKEIPIADSGAPIKSEDGEVIGVVLVFKDQTREYSVQKALEESEKRFRQLFENSISAILILNVISDESGNPTDFIILDANPSLERQTGLYPKKNIGQNLSNLIPGLLNNSTIVYLKDVLLKGENASFDTFLKQPNRFYHVNAYQLEGSKIAVELDDITESRKALEELKITQYSVDKASVAVFLMNKDGGFSYVNDLACKSLGYTREELLQLKLWDIDLVYPKDRWFDNWQQYQIDRQGGSENVETLHWRKDGTEFPVEVSSKHIWFGETELHVAFVSDISNRKKSETYLRESEERLRLAIQAANQGIFDLNIQTGEANVSPEYATMLGYEPEEFVETNAKWIERLHPDDKENVGNIYLDYINGKIPEYRVEFRQRTKSGNWKWILSLGRIVELDAEGKPLRMLGTHTDITERKNIEKDLIEAKERAENSEKLKSEFLAQMSHEIRSPINVILSYVDLIRNNLLEKIDSELLPGFDSITLAGRRIIRTIDLILNMSDLQLGTYEVNNKKFDITILLKGLVREYIQPADEKNIRINLEIDSRNCLIDSDEYAVNQIFANLIDNAVKYTDRGSITIKVNDDIMNRIVVQVSDTGIGISEEYIPVLFTPFSQEEHGYSRRFDGNGLGLSLVKKYCTLLGIEIQVKSKKNEGTTFTITFPTS